MKFNKDIPVFGNQAFRGNCPTESIEQIMFFSWLRRVHPSLGAIAIHPRNEALLKAGQFMAMSRHKAEGMVTGASDIIIPGRSAFVCEMKRQDHTKAAWQQGQQEYLLACKENGAFVCVALGCAGAQAAITAWLGS